MVLKQETLPRDTLLEVNRSWGIVNCRLGRGVFVLFFYFLRITGEKKQQQTNLGYRQTIIFKYDSVHLHFLVLRLFQTTRNLATLKSWCV